MEERPGKTNRTGVSQEKTEKRKEHREHEEGAGFLFCPVQLYACVALSPPPKGTVTSCVHSMKVNRTRDVTFLLQVVKKH